MSGEMERHDELCATRHGKPCDCPVAALAQPVGQSLSIWLDQRPGAGRICWQGNEKGVPFSAVPQMLAALELMAHPPASMTTQDWDYIGWTRDSMPSHQRLAAVHNAIEAATGRPA